MKKRRLFLVGVSVLILAIAAAGIVFSLQRSSNDPAEVIRKVGRHYMLPSDEQPAIATVTDRTKLTTEFLKVARNDDKVLIYEKSSLVIIYRPSIDRLVRVGPVSIAPSEDQAE